MKRLVPFIAAVLCAAALCGCGGTAGTPSPSPSPTIPATLPPTAGATSAAPSPSTTVLPSGSQPPAISSTVTSSFTGKVTAINADTIMLDVNNDSFKVSTGGVTPSAGSGNVSNPSAGAAGITSNVPVVIPGSAAVTLPTGKAGSVSDIRVGNTIQITLSGTAVSSVSVVGA